MASAGIEPAFEALGLAADADERAVRRAYAARLKITRPDEDPVAFQALNEAYRTALAICREREASSLQAHVEHAAQDATAPRPPPAAGDDAAADDETAPKGVSGEEQRTPQEASATDADAVAFDGDAFLDACFAAAHDGDPRRIGEWLNVQPILWSLQHKAAIGRWLLGAMDAREPPMPERNFERIAEFFGYHDLHGGLDPMALRVLRERLNEAWRKQRPNKSEGDKLPISQEHRKPKIDQARLDLDRRLLEQVQRFHPHLTEPRRWPADLWRGLHPGNVGRLVALLEAFLRQAPPDERPVLLPPPIRAENVRFWLDATDDRRWTLPRLSIAAVRCVALAVAATALLAAGALLNGSLRSDAGFLAAVFPQTLGLAAAIWLTFALYKQFLYWQAGPDPTSPWLRAAHAGAVPVLTLASMASSAQAMIGFTPFVVGGIAAGVAVNRYRGRHGPVFARFPRIHRFLAGLGMRHAIVLLVLFAVLLPLLLTMERLPVVILFGLWGIALGLWLRDRFARKPAP
jgi:hypothetical protein